MVVIALTSNESPKFNYWEDFSQQSTSSCEAYKIVKIPFERYYFLNKNYPLFQWFEKLLKWILHKPGDKGSLYFVHFLKFATV